ncbi:unnamed protein product [Caenorhabditis angaria]|uniref:FMP27/BLTP2/Hobbit GFWDK motif-containing RBG unit domain-containing protein n=1 Tax=Caenorhabditis angaria TaxID=860376 RepID=A0A9P1MT93_9PELO|nr:unnamed protein product [Caenorhabditis angaria]
MILIIAIITIILFLISYAGCIFSWLFSLLTKSEFRVGTVGFFEFRDVSVRLAQSLSIHIDCISLRRDKTHPTRFCVLQIGDVRIEGDPKKLSPTREFAPTGNEENSIEKTKIMIQKLARLAQYCGLIVNRVHLVILNVIPESMLHVTIDDLSIEMFRSRDGWQLETNCSLIQAKVLRRNSPTGSLLAELSLPLQLSLDVGKTRINKIVVRITSPSFAFTQDIFDIIGLLSSSQQNNETLEQEAENTSLINIDWQLHLNVDIESASFKYTAKINEELRYITLNIRNFVVGKSDQLQKSAIKTGSLVLNVSESENISTIEVRAISEESHTSLSFDDTLWWKKHFENSNIKLPPNRQKNSSTNTKNLDVFLELSSISCDIVDFEKKKSRMQIGFISFQKLQDEFEIGVEMLSFGRVLIENENNCLDKHTWGESLFVGAILIQWRKNEGIIGCDDVKIEWSDRFAKQINDIMRIIKSSGKTENDEKSNRKLRTFGFCGTINRISVITTIYDKSYAAICCSKIDIVSPDIQTDIIIEMGYTRGAEGIRKNDEISIDIDTIFKAKTTKTMQNNDINCSPSRRWNQKLRETNDEQMRKSVEDGINPKMFLSFDSLQILIDRRFNVIDNISLKSATAFYFSWSPHLHLIIFHSMKSIKQAFYVEQNNSTKRRVPRKRNFFIEAQNVVEIQLELARDHRILWKADTLSFEKTEGEMTVRSNELDILMNSNQIVNVMEPLIAIRRFDDLMSSSRQAFGTLFSLQNKTWTWAADRFLFHLPFDFNFAQVFNEFINIIKWIKIVHGIEKKPFTSESPLPSDVRIEFKEVVLELEDDDFENRLKFSHELKEDEVYESERRSQILEERLMQLKKNIPLIPNEILEQLIESLNEKNSEIYIERWKRSDFNKKPLFCSIWKGWNMRAFADITLHGTEKCLELMKLFDPLSSLPNDQIYSTLWARAVEFDVDEWSVTFKDYPMKYLDIKDLHFFGTLVGAESYNEGRSIREATIPVPIPWPTYSVKRNMSPLKFYYDMQCASSEYRCTYGPCWEPCLSMISLTWNNISAPSRDPSPPLPFWDKMRFLLHGKLLWSSEIMVTTMLASNDPYNETETMEMFWDDFGLDWALGEIRIKSGLRIFVRTASRYDDSQVLTLPDVRLKILLGWDCAGDSHDHHSIVLCSPDKLPHYSSRDEHDSYRQFRSSCVNVTLNFDVSPGSCTTLDKLPNVLLYSNTFRCIEQFLKSLTTKNRNVRRGSVFGNRVLLKPQLSKHFGKLQVSVSLPKVVLTYWMSHSSPFGFRVFSDGLQLTASFRQTVQHSSVNRDMNVQRRKVYSWSTHHMTCTWWATQVHVYGKESRPQESGIPSDDTFLLGFGRVQYAREAYPGKDIPLHKVTAYDLKMSWTADNRNACLTIADGVHRAHMLRRILSNDAVKTINIHLEEEEKTKNQPTSSKIKDDCKKHRRGYSMTEANPWMLTQLIDEVGTKLVAHCEQASDVPIDSLVGVQLATADDVKILNWQVDLFNSQLVLKGCERDGFLLVCAAKAQLLQNIHRSVWKDGLLLSKKSWGALLSGMQYFAPISATGWNKEKFQWLPREVIEEKTQDTAGFADDFVQKYSATGEAVGGVVQQETDAGEKVQLQRIVSRCSCQIYFVYFSDELKTEEDITIPQPQIDEKHQALVGSEEFGIDVLTLKHNMLESTSNSEQYEMVVDIVNNLALFVDPNKKALGEKRRRLRFESQMITMQELRGKIMKYQSELREIVSLGRYLERQLFYSNQGELITDVDKLEQETEETKLRIMNVSEKLDTFISCYKQRQIAKSKDIESNFQKEEVEVIRRFEVCFEDCIWKLTESDGQIALAQTQIRNFLYTRTVRNGNCGDHLFEVGSVRVTNLLPDTIYKHALHRDESRQTRQPAIRLFVRDMPPVGGICVKEHFELNISPMVAEITHRLFDKMMRFFFPGRNIHTNENLETEPEISTFSFTRKIASSLSMKNDKLQSSKSGTLNSISSATNNGQNIMSNGNNHNLISTNNALISSAEQDDIDRMRERADQVNHFMYIKIPEVSFVVSYKGNKDKNLIDVHQFNFNFPLCEFHEQNWTWLDLALAVKQRCKRVLLQQFMRQKLLRNRISNFSIDPPQQGVSEEEKKRIAIGMTSADQKQHKTK